MSEGFQDMTTLLHFQAPRFGDVAQEIYQRGVLFGARPEATDTAFDLLADTVVDVANQARDSERFDSRILERLASFRKPVFGHGVDEIVLGGDRLPLDKPPRIDRRISDLAAMLHKETPAPVRARVAGKLEMVRATDKLFSLVLQDGQRVRGIWLGEAVDPLHELLGGEVVANGTVIFRPSGSVLRLDAETLDPAKASDSFFSKLPRPDDRTVPHSELLRPQTATSGMTAVFGKWPGDESEEETLQTLAEIE
jgi:hypothetical protein